jgi:hypothetical protein
MRMELTLVFADLVTDRRFDQSLSCTVDIETGTDVRQTALASAAALVQKLRSSSPEFRAATSEHPDSYWPILVRRDASRPMAVNDTLGRPDLPRYSTGDGSISFDVSWDCCLVDSDSDAAIETVTRRTRALLAHWSEVRSAIEEARSLIERVDEDRNPDGDESRRSLQQHRTSLATSLMRADQRADCVWEYEIRFLEAARRAWGFDSFETSAERTLRAAEAHIEDIAQQQARRAAIESASMIRRARLLLLLLALSGGLATLLAVVEFLADPGSVSPRSLGRFAILAIAVALVGLAFGLLRGSAEALEATND